MKRARIAASARSDPFFKKSVKPLPFTRSTSFQFSVLRATASSGNMSTIDNSAACRLGLEKARRALYPTSSQAKRACIPVTVAPNAAKFLFEICARHSTLMSNGIRQKLLKTIIRATRDSTLPSGSRRRKKSHRPANLRRTAPRPKLVPRNRPSRAARSLPRAARPTRHPIFLFLFITSFHSLFDTFTARLLACQSTLRFPLRRPSMSSEPGRQPIIEFRRVNYRLPSGNALLKDVSFAVPLGETLVLLGRSGAGKTTALKMINRLVETNDGEVLVEGKPTLDWNPIGLRRRIGYVIQETGLFPHYTVAENISLVPKLERWAASRIRERVEELLLLVGLPPAQFMQRYPHELSGGQRQRVGVARALAADPPILLMDEPFGALDPLTRGEVRREFNDLQQRLGKTIVIVTHDISEALLLGTRIALMDAGELRGIYSPREFLRSSDPVAAAYVAQLRLLERAVEEK